MLLPMVFLTLTFSGCTLTQTPTDLKLEGNILSWNGYKGNSYKVMRQVYQNNELVSEGIVDDDGSSPYSSSMQLNIQTLPFIPGEHVYKVRSSGNDWNPKTGRFDKYVTSDWSHELRVTFSIDDAW